LKKILLINPFGIGDVLFTTPVIKALHAGLPGVEIGYWCNERVREVLKNNPRIAKVFALSRGDLKKIFRRSFISGMRGFLGLWGGIRRGHFDISLDFSLEHRYSLLSKLCGIPERIGFDYKGRGRFLTHKIPVEGYRGKHVIEYYLGILEPLGVVLPAGKPEMELFLSPESCARASALLKEAKAGQPLVGIAPGGGLSWGASAGYKHWQAQKFAQLADILARDHGCKPVILAGSDEAGISRQVIAGMKEKPIDLTGKTSLEDLCAVISRLKLLVANDGGPLHIAVAQGVATVSLFGPVDEKVYGPYPPSQKHAVARRQVSCGPCYQNFRFTGCSNQRRCLEDVSVEEVYRLARGLL